MTTPLLLRAAEIIEREERNCPLLRPYNEMLDIARQLRERHEEEERERVVSEKVARGPKP